ncbi:MAG TPA: hypothetical protein VKT31_07540 [Solirubrobacteraceae bacterium]|nr:hypothetical protein [Solirubrobacteraceae bacterium]
MNGTRDINEIKGEEGGGLDPRAAARLLEQTTREAHRRFSMASPALAVLGAATVLVALGAVWLSVRQQHPYKGPTAVGLLVMYGILACWIAIVVVFRRRAISGLSGRSVRQERAFGVAVLVALVGVSVFQGVLKHDGVSLGIVYGVYPLTAQLIVLGVLGATVAAAREEWPRFGVGIAIALVATASAFAGPRGVWLSDGIGCCVVGLGYAAAQAWLNRASASA